MDQLSIGVGTLPIRVDANIRLDQVALAVGFVNSLDGGQALLSGMDSEMGIDVLDDGSSA